MNEKKINAIKAHVNTFQYSWITSDAIAIWYGKLQSIINARVITGVVFWDDAGLWVGPAPRSRGTWADFVRWAMP
ncbi:MAG: hypothetical protein ACYS76_04460 [Planctomycetota bacterium]